MTKKVNLKVTKLGECFTLVDEEGILHGLHATEAKAQAALRNTKNNVNFELNRRDSLGFIQKTRYGKLTRLRYRQVPN